jgi:2-polyprenyl-6-methoxyphenol hydroxylase-like FAD-dependent oxidoreductase
MQDADAAPRYSGYIAWRACIDERALPPDVTALMCDNAVHFMRCADKQVVGYVIPGTAGELEVGARRLNWGMYAFMAPEILARILHPSVDAGSGSTAHRGTDASEPRRARWTLTANEVQARPEALQLATSALLSGADEHSPALRRLIDVTLERRAVFLQPIWEYKPPRLVAGRVALLGDAAHVAAPATASGAYFAMDDASALAAALEAHADGELAAALGEYQTQRLSQAQRLVDYGRSWRPGMPPLGIPEWAKAKRP